MDEMLGLVFTEMVHKLLILRNGSTSIELMQTRSQNLFSVVVIVNIFLDTIISILQISCTMLDMEKSLLTHQTVMYMQLHIMVSFIARKTTPLLSMTEIVRCREFSTVYRSCQMPHHTCMLVLSMEHQDETKASLCDLLSTIIRPHLPML